jgi:hypothetical protein
MGGREGGREGGKEGYRFNACTSMWSSSPYQWLKNYSFGQLYGSVRDEWLGTDAEGWVKANAFYAGTDLSLHCPRFESYVVTTKQTRFVEALIGAKGEGGGEGGRKGRGGGTLNNLVYCISTTTLIFLPVLPSPPPSLPPSLPHSAPRH